MCSVEVGDIIITKAHKGFVIRIENDLYVSENFFAKKEDIIELWKPYGKNTYIKVAL